MGNGDKRREQGKYKSYSAAEILSWVRADTPMMRVQTATDTVPGGLAMAMSPVLVHWGASSLGFGPDDYYLVHNINIGNNLVEGTTMLGTVRIPAGGVESVEFVMVMSKVGKIETDAGHAQLRFIFKDDMRPIILSNEGQPIANNASFKDLVLSWEAWRPPRASFDPVAGLDPVTYALTLRGYNGAVRCLADAILDRPWICYPLQLPPVLDATNELLFASLLLGDAVARQTIGGLLDRRIEGDCQLDLEYGAHDAAEWAEIKQAIADQKIPEDPIRQLLAGEIRYHLLLRSCITMALMTIDWVNERLHERGNLGSPRRIRTSPKKLPPILDDILLGKRRSTLLRVPAAMHWLMKNQTVIPGRAHLLLDEVGLLQRCEGDVLKRQFDNRTESPYGMVDDNVIY